MRQLHPQLISMVVLATLAIPGTAFCQRSRNGQISGFVDNRAGIPQPGTFVTVVARDLAVTASAYTDLHGSYRIKNVPPGTYTLKAGNRLIQPGTRWTLQLRARERAVVNLTLVTLTASEGLLPAERRTPEEPTDDWLWTLRSPANRPILRVLANASQISPRGSVEHPSPKMTGTHRIEFRGGGGAYASTGVEQSYVESSSGRNSTERSVRIRVREAQDRPSQSEVSTRISAQFDKQTGFSSQSRSLISFESQPGLISGPGGPGLQNLRIANAVRTQLGDFAVLDTGGSLDLSRSDGLLMVSHPFLRVEISPAAKLKVGYALATSAEVKGYDDLLLTEDRPAEIVSANKTLVAASGLHQELYLQKGLRTDFVRIAYFRDSDGSAIVTGLSASRVGTGPPFAGNLIPVSGLRGIMFDPSSSTFRSLGTFLGAQGWSAEITSTITPVLWLGLSYRSGDALVLRSAASSPLATEHVDQVRSDAISLSLRGKNVPTGTTVLAAYRWQPTQTITAVDRYTQLNQEPYLSLHLRQSLRCGHFLPAGMEFTADATNLLAEGYRLATLQTGESFFLAQSPRTVAAGLAVDF